MSEGAGVLLDEVIAGVNVLVDSSSRLTVEGREAAWGGRGHTLSEVSWWSTASWGCVVGSPAGALAIITSGGSDVTRGQVPKLDLSGTYDPGALAREVWWPTADGVVYESEVGVAYIEPRGVRWFFEHRDLVARVVSVSAQSVEIAGDGWEASVRLTGDPSSGAFPEQ